jgi:hypothetical protein
VPKKRRWLWKFLAFSLNFYRIKREHNKDFAMKRFIVLIFLCFLFGFGNPISAKIHNPEYAKFVSEFQDMIRNDKAEELSERVGYPFSRNYPLKPIETKEEFVKRYDEVFDDKQKEFLLRVSPNEDWEDEKYGRTFWAVSQEGTIMLKRSLIASFIDLDLKGNLIQLSASSKEREEAKRLKKDPTGLHESIKDFDEIKVIVDTGKFLVRIDRIERGAYRYASWSGGKSMSDKPDLILSNGECDYGQISGSCDFRSGSIWYSAELYFGGGVNGEISGAVLKVEKDGNTLLKQKAKLKYPPI